MLTWNRLVSVAIVVFRYMMVCHAVYCHNLGREKALWRMVMTALAALCLLDPLFSVLNSSDSLRFMMCIGKEEAFR